MVTTVGTEKDIYALLVSLAELDYDAIEAYEAAIERVENASFRKQLAQFKDDHVRHTEELGRLLTEAGYEAPSEGNLKAVLTRGKVVIAGLTGDKAILLAMRTNEEDTNVAYERANKHPEASGAILEILRKGLEDERRHRDWILQQLSRME